MTVISFPAQRPAFHHSAGDVIARTGEVVAWADCADLIVSLASQGLQRAAWGRRDAAARFHADVTALHDAWLEARRYRAASGPVPTVCAMALADARERGE